MRDDEAHEENVGDEYISEETRRIVLMRDKWKCRNCGEQDLDALTLHHVKYRSHGGGHESTNLVTVCWECHRKIHDKKLIVRIINGLFFFGEVRHWRQRYRR